MFDFINAPLPHDFWVWLALARFLQFAALCYVTQKLLCHRVHILALLPFLASLSYFGTQLFITPHTYDAGTVGFLLINTSSAAGYYVIGRTLSKLLIRVHDARVERLLIKLITFLKER